jgi:hypothetical protein
MCRFSGFILKVATKVQILAFYFVTCDKNLELFLQFQDTNKFLQTEIYVSTARKKIKSQNFRHLQFTTRCLFTSSQDKRTWLLDVNDAEIYILIHELKTYLIRIICNMDRQTGNYWHCTSLMDSMFSIPYPTNKILSNILWY